MEIGLADVIDSLRRELLELDRYPSEKVFVLGDIEIEMKFVIEKTAEAKGGGHYLFFAAEAKGSYKKENVHSIKLKLTPNPEWRGGRRVMPSAGGA
jgi:hypothetical protein